MPHLYLYSPYLALNQIHSAQIRIKNQLNFNKLSQWADKKTYH